MMKHLLIAATLLLLPLFIANAEEQDEGTALFEARCALCHQLPDPKMLTARQWERVLKVMQLRIEQKGMPQLPEEEIAAIQGYLQQNARR